MNKRKISVGNIILSPLAKKYVNQVLNSNRLSYGPFSKKFENKFAKLHDSKYAVFSNSGTDSLKLSLQALKEIGKWKDNYEVIVPAITFIASSNVILMNNLKPIFVDVKLDTYNIDPSKIEAAITKKTRAIMVVHLMGLPCDMKPIWKIAKKYKLKIIEDSCETMLATCDNKKVGSLSDVGCFSTYVAHLLVTGVGGLATTNNKKLATKIRSLMNHGRDEAYLTIDDDNHLTGKKLRKVVAKRFSYVSVGHSARCTEMEAAIGLAQLKDLEKIVKQRQSIANKLIKELKSLEDFIQLPVVPKGRTHSFMLFPILVKKEKKQGLINHLEENGIETRDLMPLLNQPIYKKIFGNIENKYPNAKKIGSNGFYIGCHQYLTQKDIDYIVSSINSYFNKKPTIVTLLDTPAFGGAEQYVLDSSKILNNNGHKIIIYTNNKTVKTKYLDFIKNKNIKNFEVKDLPYLLDAIGDWKGLIKFFIHLPKAFYWFHKTLKQIINKEKKVVCLLVGFTDRLVFSPIVKDLKAKLIWVDIGPLQPVFKRNWGFPQLLYKLTKYFPDHFNTTSQFTLKSMVKIENINKEKTSLVYPGVQIFTKKQIETFKNKGNKWRKKNTNTSTLVGFVGRMATENEVDLLITAFAKAVKKSKLKMQLVLIGDGPEKKRFENLAEELNIFDKVIFTGFVSVKEKFSILATCNLFVFPRAWSWDGFGITTIEAMTVGTAVISPNFGPQREIINNNINGLNFKPKNSNDLSKKIITLAKSKRMQNKFSKNGLVTVKENFSYKVMKKNLLNSLKQVE